MASSTELSNVIQEKLNHILTRFDELQAILISTSDGVPLIKAFQADQDAESYEYTEAMFPAVFASAAEQIGKLKLGSVKSITSFYGSLVLVHVNQLPLVVTLIAPNTPSVGALQTVGLQLRDALEPLKKYIETADVH